MNMFNKYKFSDKSPTLGGTISMTMGLVALAFMICGIYISFKAHGSAGMIVGACGLIALIVSFIGTVIGLMSFKEENKFYGLSKAGSYFCGILFIVMFSVMLMGLGL